MISLKMVGGDLGHVGETILLPVFQKYRKLLPKKNGTFFIWMPQGGQHMGTLPLILQTRNQWRIHQWPHRMSLMAFGKHLCLYYVCKCHAACPKVSCIPTTNVTRRALGILRSSSLGVLARGIFSACAVCSCSPKPKPLLMWENFPTLPKS